jgi:predicted esterase
LVPVSESEWRRGVLTARPTEGETAGDARPGLQWLGGPENRATALYVPNGLDPSRPAPVVVLLHGAGGQAMDILPLMQALADDRKFLIVAPQSKGATWDVIGAGYGPDIAAMDRALGSVFKMYRVDRSRIAVGGFSDGASYALSVGLTNGDLFSDVLAFSPGFIAPGRLAEEPRVFISHGTHDPVLPIDRCSRRIVPRLQQGGYDVDYREFEGGHVVPTEMVIAALDRFLSH